MAALDNEPRRRQTKHLHSEKETALLAAGYLQDLRKKKITILQYNAKLQELESNK